MKILEREVSIDSKEVQRWELRVLQEHSKEVQGLVVTMATTIFELVQIRREWD
jgi:hypothetical protein